MYTYSKKGKTHGERFIQHKNLSQLTGSYFLLDVQRYVFLELSCLPLISEQFRPKICAIPFT